MPDNLPFDPAHTCCFSGSRPEKLGFDWTREPFYFEVMRTDLRAAIRRAVDLEYTRFITGMSRGFDLWAAQEVIAMRRSIPDLVLVAALPFPDMACRWPAAWRTLYEHTLQQCNYEVQIAGQYYPGCYHARDTYMVQQSSRIICWYNGSPGGTAFTCHQAERRGLTLDNIHRPYYHNRTLT